MKLLLVFIMASVAALGQRQSALTITPIAPEPLYATTPAAFAPGPYAILNAHTNQALAAQAIVRRRFAAQLDVAGDTWEFLPAASGGFLIRGQHGFLEEMDGQNMVRIGDAGTEWEVGAIEGGDTFQIRAKSGRVLEIANWSPLPGAWAALNEVTGGSNQEWRITRESSVMTAPVSTVASVRGRKGHLLQSSTAAAKTAPIVSWSKQDGSFVYRVRAEDAELTWLWLGRTSGYDSADVATPAGWHFGLSGWFADTQGAAGEFALRSAWAPGPVILQAIGKGGESVFEYDPERTTNQQHDALLAAQLNRGSHSWVIGPAIPPGTTAEGLRALARTWVAAGLAFVGPLLDESRDVRLALSELQPQSEVEQQVVAALCRAINQQ